MKNIDQKAKSSFEAMSIEAQAHAWHERMAGTTNAKTEQAFDDWMSLSAQHRQAYFEAELLFDGLSELAKQPEVAAMLSDSVNGQADLGQATSMVVPIKRTGPITAMVTAMALAASFAFVVIYNPSWFGQQPPTQVANVPQFVQQYQTVTAQLRDINLPDGSALTLGPNSLVKVNYDLSSRRVDLLQGEAYFDVSKDSRRPFYVESERTSVKVVGTRFDVRRLAQATSVSVVEGIVQVFNGKDSARLNASRLLPTTLLAGQYAHSDGDGEIEVKDAANGHELVAWKQGRLVYQGAELRNVVADANRYTKARSIRLHDEVLEQQTVTLSVNVDNLDELPLMLAQLMGLKIKHTPEEIVLSLNR